MNATSNPQAAAEQAGKNYRDVTTKLGVEWDGLENRCTGNRTVGLKSRPLRQYPSEISQKSADQLNYPLAYQR